ncbi:hypothetical protein HHK36_002031 [Tetracentron sinense]|uniref:non-specific serine/threonine protein kinase n=1 Tax=Tetracentron sinense TaxID=13715 RepID=A0A835DVL4_TETSI|nr:hypothetical protein HHK36_002031 [Tetracentron sinense]
MERLQFFIFSFACLFFTSNFSIAIDTISPNQTITGGQTLVSAGKIFEMGFFTPGTSNDRYLGIWFKSILPQTVVWVANRNNPLTNSSGALMISRDGNIVLLNQTDSVIWFSNSSIAAKNPVAQLLNSGNLVLRDGNSSNPENYLWQSFDYPFDTLLPGMKLGANLRSGQNWYLTSWRSEDDPSPGDYTYKVDHHGLPQIVLRKGSDVQFRSGSWDGVRFGDLKLDRNSVFNPIFIFNEENVYYGFENNNRSAISRFVVNQTGSLQHITWNDRRLEWVVIFTLQKDSCDSYAICGAYGTCNINNGQICKCLKGFTPRSPQDYNALDWAGGCVPRSPVKCGSKEGFRKFTGIKLPDRSNFNRNMSSMECEPVCSNNCSCVAYAKTDNRGCVFWFGDLMDIREYGEGGQEFYIRMAASELGKFFCDLLLHLFPGGLVPSIRSDGLNKVRSTVHYQMQKGGRGGRSICGFGDSSLCFDQLVYSEEEEREKTRNTYELELFQAWNLWNEGKLLELIDASMEDLVPESEALKYIQVGLLCVQKRPEDRPTMPSVLLMLDSESAVLRQPKQPGFYTERFLAETDSSTTMKKSCASNDVTVTMLEDAVDTIAPNQTITNGQALVSAGEIFEFGFFSPGNSKNRYLGIWYKNIGQDTGVWVANRNNPVTDSSGALTIGRDGNIVLLNRSGNVIWSSNSSISAKTPVIQLLDTGNLVLRDASSGNPETYLWQSFDYPCDTVVAGMKLGWNLKTGQDWNLTSWKNLDDPSQDGVRFGGGPEQTRNTVFDPTFISNTEDIYYTFQNNEKSVISRFVVNQSGSLQHLTWNQNRREWVVFITMQKDTCDEYGLCRSYGTCNINNSPLCKCLEGFVPKSRQDWNMLDWSGGCVPRTPLKCGKGEGFRKFKALKLPDTSRFMVNKSMSHVECEDVCLNDCSCVAYAETEISGCVVWFGDLLDVREYSEGGKDLFIRMPASELADTLIPSRSISGGETLVSQGGFFELGFFSPGNSKNRYLGIWYNRIPVRTVVWVANRENPLTNSSGILKIDDKGNLVLVNRTESVIWSSNSSKAAENPVVQLLESGNLVLRDEKDGNSESYVWQSFDYPSDTMLPGMKLGWDLKKGLNRRLSSWKSADDPSPGGLTYGIENEGYPEAVTREDMVKRYRSGPWNGIRFSGAPELRPNPVFWFSLISNENEVYYTYELYNKLILSRLVLNESNGGVRQRFTWTESHGWQVFLSVPRDLCDTYRLCGAYGTCEQHETTNCQCPKGFKPRLLEAWNSMDWSGGCIRKVPLDCEKGDGFVKYTELKLPDTTHAWANKSMSLKECKRECLKNCNCTAYTNSDISGRGSGCAMWFGDLIDIRQIRGAGQDLYIRMAASELAKEDESMKRVIMIIVGIVVASGALLAWKLWSEGKPLELMDAMIEDPVPVAEALRCIQVGLLCVQQHPRDRLMMSSVLLMLDSESAVLPQPKQPGFYIERFLGETDSSSSRKKSYTENEITVTMLDGR